MAGIATILVYMGMGIAFRSPLIASRVTLSGTVTMVSLLALFAFIGGIVSLKSARHITDRIFGITNMFLSILWVIVIYLILNFPCQH